MRDLRRILLTVTFAVVAAAALLAGGLIPSRRGEAPRGAAFAQVREADPCLTATASASVTLGPSQIVAKRVSPDSSYSTTGCRRWVVDFSVGQLLAIPGRTTTFEVDGDPADGDFVGGEWTEECATAEVNISIYKKAADQARFLRIGGGQLIGANSFGACVLRRRPGFATVPSQSPPARGTDVYRVAISAKRGNAFKRVEAGVTRDTAH